jgi:exopolyphosphatase/guanosine-5'-triphosphate,3'-diphosphate pyrophosphatase
MSQQEVRYGVIDLGSNTARLIIMTAIPGYAYRLEDEIREVVRLRQGMTARGLSQEAMDRAYFALRLFKRFCDAIQVDVLIPTATSAVREAANGPDFLDRVERELGMTMQVLDGEREAYYGVIGAINDVDIRKGYVMDIGGGSAQISRVEDQRFVRGQSALLGALALTEGFVTTDPISKREYKALQAEIERQLDGFDWLAAGNGPLVGLGGAIRNLAGREAARSDYPLNTLHGFRLSAESLAKTIDELRTLPLAKRRKLAGLRPDRADIILPGAMVAQAVMARLGVDGLTISVNGLREGLFLERFWGHLDYPVAADVRSFGVLNLARIYRYQKRHANHVRFLARRVFDQLQPLHGYGPPERELLDAASLLHDLGSLINYDDHHHHSQMLIVSNGLPGFAPREIALIALLTRYHRKGTPTLGAFASIMEPGDKARLTRLAAILRLAEYLERGRNSAVDDVIVTWTDEELRITLVADFYPAVELWQSERYAVELLSTAFKRAVRLESAAAPWGSEAERARES